MGEGAIDYNCISVDSPMSCVHIVEKERSIKVYLYSPLQHKVLYNTLNIDIRFTIKHKTRVLKIIYSVTS